MKVYLDKQQIFKLRADQLAFVCTSRLSLAQSTFAGNFRRSLLTKKKQTEIEARRKKLTILFVGYINYRDVEVEIRFSCSAYGKKKPPKNTTSRSTECGTAVAKKYPRTQNGLQRLFHLQRRRCAASKKGKRRKNKNERRKKKGRRL